jgi:hypothetical protein
MDREEVEVVEVGVGKVQLVLEVVEGVVVVGRGLVEVVLGRVVESQVVEVGAEVVVVDT